MTRNKSEDTASAGAHEEARGVAKWTIAQGSLTNRLYFNKDRSRIDPSTKGSSLPAASMAKEVTPESKKDLLSNTKLFSDLPGPFYKLLLETLNATDEQLFPRIFEDKRPTMRECLKNNQTFNEEKWQELGWNSREDYSAWLNKPALFAFSGCGHYCSSPRVFDYKGTDKAGNDVFEFVGNKQPAKTTHIFSIAGFECRGIDRHVADSSYINTAITEGKVKDHAKIIMNQILQAAVATKTTDVVLIPVGMGVFLMHRPEDMKREMLDGWIEALNDYRGRPITIQCCLMPGQFQKIKDHLNNTNIQLENRTGSDAYSVANAIQDTPGKKSMLVNAGDHDWIASLDREKYPSQLSSNHTLYHTTSDEYFGLMTLFSLFSVKNIIEHNRNLEDVIISSYQTAAPAAAAAVETKTRKEETAAEPGTSSPPVTPETPEEACANANAMSDHNAYVNKSAKLVSQNLQGPYAVSRRTNSEDKTKKYYVFDLPEWINLKQEDASSVYAEKLSNMTGMDKEDCEQFIQVMKEKQNENEVDVDTFLSSVAVKYPGINQSLGQGKFRISIESDAAYKTRMRKQIGHLINTIAGGAEILCIQEQPYKENQGDTTRTLIFNEIMGDYGYVCVADVDQRDVGIWVKKTLQSQFTVLPSTAADLTQKIQGYPYRGCVIQSTTGLYINLHMDRVKEGADHHIDALIGLKKDACAYAAKRYPPPPLQVFISGDMNLFQLTTPQIDKLKANGFVVTPVKGQKKFDKKTCEAYFGGTEPTPTLRATSSTAPSPRKRIVEGVKISPSTLAAYKKLLNRSSVIADFPEYDSPEQEKLRKAAAVLNDYTKGNSAAKRALHFHWNRHHTVEVNEIVTDINNGTIQSTKDLLDRLKTIATGDAFNKTGSLARRIKFIEEEIVSIQATPSSQEGPSP